MSFLSFRIGDARPFVGSTDADDGRQTQYQLGLTTYTQTDEGEAYETSYFTAGARSDHAENAIERMHGSEPVLPLVADIKSDDELGRVGSVERNKQSTKDNNKSSEATA